MILKPGPDALPHLFLKGFRAPAAGTGDTPNPMAEEVGVFVARQKLGFDGQPRDPGKVLDADLPFDPPNKPEGPFRFEAEIPTTKPELDLVIVDDFAAFLTPLEQADPALSNIIVTKNAGSVSVDTGTGFGAAIPRQFGWQPRAFAPRLALAGREGDASDPASLTGFKPDQFKLPAKYFNAFNMGNPGSGVAALKPGDRVRYTDLSPASTDVTIPPGPVLAVSQDEAPLSPPLALTPRVDTVVFDKADQTVTLVWRAVFPWEARFDSATLEVN
jgi:hypothetical protein